MKLPVIALAAFGAALLFAAPAHAQPNVVQNQLDSAAVLLTNAGYQQQDDFVTGSMDANAGEDFEVTLEAGREYAIIGFCDNDCSDLDLVLTDADGDMVDSDVAGDDYPVVEVEPGRNGTYNLRVVMAACSVEPCFYGVGVFAKN